MRASPSLLLIVTTLADHRVKGRLRIEPACKRRADSLLRVERILVRDLDRLVAPAAGCSVGQQLRLAAPLEQHEPVDGLLDGPAACPVWSARVDLRMR
jgi:hypothetical protein